MKHPSASFAKRLCELDGLCAVVLLVLLLAGGAPLAAPAPASPSKHKGLTEGPLKEAPRSAVIGEACLVPDVNNASFLCLPGYSTGRISLENPELKQLADNWSEVKARHEPKKAFGTANTLMKAPVLAQWKNLCAKMNSLPAVQQLQYINGFYNRWGSVTDKKNYGQNEYWASPEEFISKGGDCEDYAITKYFALRHFGWKEENMWLLLIRDQKRSENHAVLAVREKDRIFILDNLSSPAYLLIPLDKYLQTNTAYYAVNSHGLLAFFKTAKGRTQAARQTLRGGAASQKPPR